jgi:hypothetical protein
MKAWLVGMKALIEALECPLGPPMPAKPNV